MVKKLRFAAFLLMGCTALLLMAIGAQGAYERIAPQAYTEVMALPIVPCDVISAEEMKEQDLYVVRQEDGVLKVVHSTEPLPTKFVVTLMSDNRRVITAFPKP
jgi:hypothetical protein